ncbi:hypothetical protein RYX36_025514, partial [Vicia faba]
GTKIQVIIHAFYTGNFNSTLNPNNTYTISNFQVQKNELLFNMCDHGYLLKFTGRTRVSDNNKHTIVEASMNSKKCTGIISGNLRRDRLIGYFMYNSWNNTSSKVFATWLVLLSMP